MAVVRKRDDCSQESAELQLQRRLKTQLDFLKEAVALAEQNPTLKIHFASSDEHCEDKKWKQQHITKVEKTLYYTRAEEKMEKVILIYTND